MNFVDVELEREADGSGRLVGDDFNYEVSSRLLQPLDPSTSELEFGIRPENVRVDPEVPPKKRIETTVDVVEVVGSDNFIYLDLAGKEFRVRTPTEVEPAEGETVALTFDEDDIHLFDSQTGEALVHGYPDTDVSTTVEQSDTTAD